MAEEPVLIDPTPAAAGGDPLTPDQVASWRERGFCFVSGILPADLVEELRTSAADRFPTPGTDEANAIADFGSAIVFPSEVTALNRVALHRRLLRAMGQLLGRPIADLRLSQADLWPKYGRVERTAGSLDNQDQRIHVDYPNHTLAHPAPWDRPEAVEAILYLADHADCGGSTAVVPRTGPDDPAYRWPIVDTPGVGQLRYVNDRRAAEAYLAEVRPELAPWRAELYRRERHTRYRTGDIIFYRHDTWHRGTPLRPGGFRLAMNLTYRRAECEWISTLHPGWSWSMYRRSQYMERLIATADLDQRAVLGFPQPGSPYWCEETLAAVEARYGALGFDPRPYRS
ncbi:MAG: hypothetical protein AAF547_16360 [Actinomycetota bacterium]